VALAGFEGEVKTSDREVYARWLLVGLCFLIGCSAGGAGSARPVAQS
jgi:hypothetical protein